MALPPVLTLCCMLVLVDSERSVAGDVLCRYGHMLRAFPRRASMLCRRSRALYVGDGGVRQWQGGRGRER